MRKRTILILTALAAQVPMSLIGCSGAKSVGVALNSGPGPGEVQVRLLRVATGANSLPDAFNPPLFGAVVEDPNNNVTVTFNGPVQGTPVGFEPPTVDLPVIVGPDFTPNPALVAGRGNIDFFLNVNAGGLPAPNNAAGGYDVDAPDAEAANPFYFSRVTPNAGEAAVADNRPFRSNMIRNGVLQMWIAAQVPVPFSTTPPPVGQRQVFQVWYRRRTDATGVAGSLRAFTNPAGAPPAGIAADDIRIQLPSVVPVVDAAAPHPLAGAALNTVIRMVGLPTFRANPDGSASVRVFVIGERVLDAATSGGFEIAILPRNIIDPAITTFQLVLVRTVPGNEAIPVQHFLQGMRTFGIGVSLEPPGEATTNLTLRNPIDVAQLRD